MAGEHPWGGIVRGRKESLPLQRQQLELLFRQAPAALAGGVPVVLLTAWVLRNAVPANLLWIWTAVALAVNVFRLLVTLAYRRAPEERRGDALWERLSVLGALMGGVVWGAGSSSFLFVPDSVSYQAFLIIALGGLAASTTVTNSPVRWCSPAFVLTATVPIGLRCLYEADEIHFVMAGLVFTFVLTLYISQKYTHRAVVQGLSLGLEKIELLESLRVGNERFNNAQKIAGFGNWEWDIFTNELHWSEEIFRLFGFEPGQLINQDIVLNAVHPEDRHLYKEALDAAIKGEPLNVEFRIVRPDGEVRTLRDQGELFRDTRGKLLQLKGVMSDVSERTAAESQTRTALRELNRILENMQDTYIRTDEDGRITFASRSIETLLGYTGEQAVGLRMRELYVNADECRLFRDELIRRNGSLRNFEILLRHKSGRMVWVSANAQFIRDDSTTGVEGTMRDITDFKYAEEALHQEKERALVTLQSIGDGVVTTDERGRVQFLNPVAERLLGYKTYDAAGRHYLEILRLTDEATGESLGDLVKLCLSREAGAVHAEEGMFVHADGTRYHLKVTAAPMRNREGHLVGAVLALHDITAVMGMARELTYQASHDRLTGLHNRAVFEEKLEEAIRAAQSGQSKHVLFYLDLDQFKVVNDTCGHQAGDELLEQVATLMQRRVRDTDMLARLGGDEFGVLLENCPVDKAVGIAEEIRKTIREFRFGWKDKVFDIGVSIGVVPIDASSGSLASVLSAADSACYVAKDHGRNRIYVFQPDDDAVAQRHGEMEWVHRLSAAFDENRFILYAQPIVHLDKERLTAHYEILMRMLDKKGNVVPPMAFIPAAERYNLMPTIDRWVIRTTFSLMREAQGLLAFPPVNCAINLSGQSLNDDHFLEFVVELFDDTGIPPESICFEITETAAIANFARATRFINVFRDMGCSFALDDFGSGLSSFAYLKNLPVDYLKIDGSFVKDMVEDRVDRAMVSSINDIGHVLGLKTIAEFAENDDVIRKLEELGVDYAQGHGVEMPKPFAAILDAYAQWRTGTES